LLDGKYSAAITRLGAFTTVAIVEKIRYARGHETIVSRYFWKASMNKSISQLAPWAGPAYLALADAIELAIRAGSVQAGDRLPPQRILADFLGLHVQLVAGFPMELNLSASLVGTGCDALRNRTG
jgi:hypothetical protein